MVIRCEIANHYELRPFGTPNFVLVDKTFGAAMLDVELPKFALADIDADTLSALCRQFREDVFKKAGKRDPQLEK